MEKVPKTTNVPMRLIQRVGVFLPDAPPKVTVKAWSEFIYWLFVFSNFSRHTPWGIPVSSAASPRPEGMAVG